MNLPLSLARGTLTEDDVRSIKDLLFDGTLTQGEIAEKFSITQPTVSRIFRGTEWGHVVWPDGAAGPINAERRREIRTSRARNTRFEDNRARKDISDIAAQAAVEVSETIAALSQQKEDDLADKISLKKKSWAAIKKADPSHQLVKKLEKEHDPHLKEAVQITFNKIPQEKWGAPSTIRLINQLRDSLAAQE